MVQKHYLHTAHLAFVHTKRVLSIQLDSYVVHIIYTCWIFRKIASLSLSIALVVWRDYPDLLAEKSESVGEFINHNS